jgi:ankyrin repeat domain-containing protein 50
MHNPHKGHDRSSSWRSCLDALDECEESGRFELIDFLHSFQKNVSHFGENQSTLRFLVTSRPYFDIEQRFALLTRHIPTIRLRGEMELEWISKEINLVIESIIPSLALELQLDHLEQSTLQSELLRMTHRTYLWLRLILDVIRNEIGPTKKRLRQVIGSLPDTVDKAYEAILSKVRDKKRARKLLCIVVAAARPLTLNEMNIALAIEDHHRSYEDLGDDLENQTRFKDTVRQLCGLFVNVIDQRFYLIHQTAKEFLLAQSKVCGGVWKHSIEPADSELVIARTCVTYLLFTEFNCDWGMGELDWGPRESKGKLYTDYYHYLGYAASQWPAHFKKAQVRAEDGILRSVLDTCDTQSQRFRNWFSIYWTLARPYEDEPHFTSSLVAGSCFGHEAVVKLLLDTDKVEVDSMDGSGRTPLSWAAENGHEAVVKLLLDTGKVKVDSEDVHGWTPLSWATGIEPENENELYHLDWAAWNGHEAVVKLLLGAGKVKVDSKDRHGRAPLS